MKFLQRFAQKAFYDPHSRLFLPINNALAAVTLVSVLSIVLETVPTLSGYARIFSTIEYVVVSIFITEFILRLVANKARPFDYLFSVMGIIDLLAIVPSLFAATNLTFLKTARVIRILLFLRIVRVAKFVRAPKVGLHDPEHQAHLHRMNVRIYFAALFSSVVVFATLMYLAEGEVQPEAYGSIPLSMIWAAKVTMGGVAQDAPITALGDIITIMTRFTGLALLGLLIHIIGTSTRRVLFGSDSLEGEKLTPQKKAKQKKRK